MKPHSIYRIMIQLFTLAGCSTLIACAEEKNEHIAGEATSIPAESAENIEGTWHLVWSKTNGVENKGQIPTQFKIINNGFFSFIMKDSTGNWNIASAGTYKLEGDKYIETHLYSTEPSWIGSTYGQQYSMLPGDTLYIRLFTKVTNSNGEDVTDQYPAMEEKRVRANQ